MQIASPQTDAARTAVLAARAVDAVKIYGKGDTAIRALDGIDVNFGKGEFSVIMGPSGSGKSTLMHCLAGLDTLTSGQILIGDTDLGTLDDKRLTQLRRDRVGFIFQAFNLVPTLTAEENIALPRPAQAPPQRTLWWSAAAGRGRPCPRHPAGNHLR
jgi:putative ABC transport system ATP-binding protein